MTKTMSSPILVVGDVNMYDVTVWCADYLGDGWFNLGRWFYFFDDESYTMFALRWADPDCCYIKNTLYL